MSELLSRVVFSDRGGGNARGVVLANLRVSWEVNRAGLLGGQAPEADLAAAGLPNDLLGKWVRYDHPTAGSWGGVVTACSGNSGLVDVAAQSFEILTNRRTSRLYQVGSGKKGKGSEPKPLSGTPGALFEKALLGATLPGGLYPLVGAGAPLSLGPIDKTGGSTAILSLDEDLYDAAIPQLTDDVGYEWAVSADRVVSFRAAPARPASAPRLVEGADPALVAGIASSRWADDLLTVETVLQVWGLVKKSGGGRGRRSMPLEAGRKGGKRDKDKQKGRGKDKKKGGKKAPTVYVDTASVQYDQALVNRFGPLVVVRTLDGKFSQAQLTAEAQRLKAELARQTAAVELTLVDEGGAFAAVRDNRWLMVDLGPAGIAGWLRWQVRALDVAAGTMVVSGDGWRR